MTTVSMIALRSITASQSPKGQAIARGQTYELPEKEVEGHIRRGLGKNADAPSKKAETK